MCHPQVMQTSAIIGIIAELLQFVFTNTKTFNDSSALWQKTKNFLKPQEFAVFELSQGINPDFKDLHSGTRCVSRNPDMGIKDLFHGIESYPQFHPPAYKAFIHTSKVSLCRIFTFTLFLIRPGKP